MENLNFQGLSDEQKKKLAEALGKKINNITCPMCKNQEFSITDGYFNNVLQSSISAITLGGQMIPTIAVICTNCGFVSQHALGRLGFLEKNENR